MATTPKRKPKVTGPEGLAVIFSLFVAVVKFLAYLLDKNIIDLIFSVIAFIGFIYFFKKVYSKVKNSL